jgi:hypothetical protein
MGHGLAPHWSQMALQGVCVAITSIVLASTMKQGTLMASRRTQGLVSGRIHVQGPALRRSDRHAGSARRRCRSRHGRPNAALDSSAAAAGSRGRRPEGIHSVRQSEGFARSTVHPPIA